MKINVATAMNFGSFEKLHFRIDDLRGAVVIEGDTGSGKSTLLDIIAWGLYGETSKATKSDEVRQWGSKDPAVVSVHLTNNDKACEIRRTRGDKNDLCLYLDGGEEIRGVNLKDTQSIINEFLRLDYEAFISSSYFTQFSEAEQFFTARPSDRRVTLEKLVDTEKAISLGLRCLEEKKKIKQELIIIESARHGLQSRLEGLQEMIGKREKEAASFRLENEEKSIIILKKLENIKDIVELERKEKFLDITWRSLNGCQRVYQEELQKIRHLIDKNNTEHTCPACSAVFTGDGSEDINELEKSSKIITNRLASIHERIKIKEEKLMSIKREIKAYYKEESPAILNQLFDLYSTAKNTHEEQVVKMKSEAEEKTRLLTIEKDKKNRKLREIAHLEVLYDISLKLRSRLLQNSISSIQTEINRLLVKHFDAEIKLDLFMLDGDSLEVSITRNGNACSFKALSGGQRCILKLCLWLAIKKAVESKNHTNVNLVMLDESLHGLSDRLKQQAYGLIEEIANTHASVLVVDHNEGLKSCFSKKITVYQYQGHSQLSYE